MRYGIFQVTGSFVFRGHKPGETFEAKVTPQINRAAARGNIVMLEEIVPEVPPGWVVRGWPPDGGRVPITRSPAEAGFLIGGGR